ncbi:hypothetical protein HNR44_003151 [Geomicrobium halophilum]|uniref:DUF2642 domain-containing protein n=1 Tax=Geomicrobium halophilum TaxID=549000 RepID=A0A841PQL1_9BACL|nr:YuzF family protein [Geomicrobium halophilum]MBB6451157.1 hypothetical protein [Geomicrobium halophilum]
MSNMEWMLSDPYMYHSLLELEGEIVGVQTIRSSVRGHLRSVQPDHIVVEMGGVPFYVRMQQIIWAFPAKSDDKREIE